MCGFRTRLEEIAGAGGEIAANGDRPIPMPGFRTWLGIIWGEAFLEPQDVAGRHLPLGHGIDARHAAQQTRALQPVEMVVQC